MHTMKSKTPGWFTLVVTISLLFLAGCAKGAASSASPGFYGGMPGAPMEEAAYDGGDAYYDDDMAMGDMEEMAEMEYARAERSAAMLDAPPSAPAPSAGPAGGKAAVEPEPKPEPDPNQAGEADEPTHGRQIIYTASMQVGVFNVEESVKRAELLPEQYGGWVHTRRNDFVQMKIPAARLEEAMEAVAKIGRVEDRQLDAQDVTAEFVDLQSRIKVLKRTQNQLLALLEQAKTVEEALAVRKALDQVTMELEVALGRMRQLKNMIAFSTLSVRFVEQSPHVNVDSQNDPFPWVDSLGVEATEWN